MSLKKRLKEPSTYAGFGMVIAGLGQMFNFTQAEQVATLVKSAGTTVASGDYVQGGILLALGLAGIFMREKGSQ